MYLNDDLRRMPAKARCSRIKRFNMYDPEGNVLPGQDIRRATVELAVEALLNHWGVEVRSRAGAARGEHDLGQRPQQDGPSGQSAQGDGECVAASFAHDHCCGDRSAEPTARRSQNTPNGVTGTEESSQLFPLEHPFDLGWVLEPLPEDALGQFLPPAAFSAAPVLLEQLRAQLEDAGAKKKRAQTRSATRRAAQAKREADEASETALERSLRMEVDELLHSILSGEQRIVKRPETGWPAEWPAEGPM